MKKGIAALMESLDQNAAEEFGWTAGESLTDDVGMLGAAMVAMLDRGWAVEFRTSPDNDSIVCQFRNIDGEGATMQSWGTTPARALAFTLIVWQNAERHKADRLRRAK